MRSGRSTRTGPVARAPSGFAFAVGSTMGSADRHPRRLADRHRRPEWRGRVRAATQTGAGPWVTAVGTTTARSATRTLTFGHAYGFRVRARDGAGNWGAFVDGSADRPVALPGHELQGHLRGSWRRYATSSASGGRTHYATRAGAAATFRFTGRAFALDRAEGSDPRQREAVRRWRLRRRPSACTDRVRATDRGRGTVVVESGAQRSELVVVGTAAPPTGRHRRLRDPALSRLNCRGRSSSRTAPATAGRGSSVTCRSPADPR